MAWLGSEVGVVWVQVCWVPFFTCHMANSLCILLREGKECVDFVAFFFTTWLGYMNSFMNPVRNTHTHGCNQTDTTVRKQEYLSLSSPCLHGWSAVLGSCRSSTRSSTRSTGKPFVASSSAPHTRPSLFLFLRPFTAPFLVPSCLLCSFLFPDFYLTLSSPRYKERNRDPRRVLIQLRTTNLITHPFACDAQGSHTALYSIKAGTKTKK